MAFNLKDFLKPLLEPYIDLGEDRVKELIVFGGLVVLALIVIWRRA